MLIAHHHIYAHPLPEGHRFPMEKYELIPAQLLHEGAITQQEIVAPEFCPDEVILQTHTAEYLNALHDQTLDARAQRKIGFPLSPRLVQRELMIAQGTIDGMYAAMKDGVAFNVAGGTHHAFAERGEGFCMLNDQAIAANYFLRKNPDLKIMIVDLDVHQGNGTAKLFENEPRVFTFSMHGAHNYPFKKEKSDLDVELQDGCTDDEYLALLQKHLPLILKQQQPDLVFYLAGVDVLATDRFGKLKLTRTGCKQRDRFVFEHLKSMSIPCQVSMGGGYSPNIADILEAHCNTYRVALEIFAV